LRDYVHPLNVWVAYLSINEDLLEGSSIGLSQSAIKGRVITVVPDTVGKSVRSAMICAYPTNDTTSLSQFHKANKSIESLKELVQATFEDMPGKYVPRLLEHMRASPDFYAGEVVQVKVRSLYKDRFVMVGDAGYAPGFAGTGTTLALTGAYVLAGEISRSAGDLGAGLQNYEARMRPIIDKMQKLPPGGMGVFAPQTGWGLWFRNTVYSIVVKSGIADFAQKRLFSQSAGLDEFSLEDYSF
jgi:2-polyprenyl-6-methoxyphenol hydroxylase-like FAD-dependent oxidoreductase